MIRAAFPLKATILLFFALWAATPMAREYGDIYMDSSRESMKKAKVGAVLFPHWFHRIRYKCKVCHEDIFIMRKGANKITMQDIIDGKSCGRCHNGLIAWETLYCNKCHSVKLRPSILDKLRKKRRDEGKNIYDRMRSGGVPGAK